MITRNREAALKEAAEKAVRYAYYGAMGQLKTLKRGVAAFYPKWDVKKGAIGVGIAPENSYLIYQENGIASFSMTSLYKKVVPMRIDGKIVFRYVTGINRFRSGNKVYWRRDGNGDLISEYKQARAWVHPGLAPKNFVRDAVRDASEESADSILAAKRADTMADIAENVSRYFNAR